MAEYETIPIDSLSVACDGGGGALGHPRVYPHLKQEQNEITCPYCSRRFVLQGASHPHTNDKLSAYGG